MNGAEVLAGVDRSARTSPARPATATGDSDLALVRAAQNGELTAFEGLVRRHEDSLFGYLLRMTGNRSTAEELAQATFIRAWEKLGTFRREASFKTWLFRIAHSLCVNHLTRVKPMEQLPDEVAANAESEPDEVLRRRELTEEVRRALDRLEPDQRTCLVLAVFEEMSYREIAQVAGKSVRAVDSLLVRARQNLRTLLERAERRGLIFRAGKPGERCQ